MHWLEKLERLRVIDQMLLDFCISRNARASKCRHGSTIRFQCRFHVDAIDARQELAAFPLVFQEVAVSLRPCPEHLFYSIGLVLEEFERHGKAAVYTGEFFQRAVEDVHLEFVPRHGNPRRTERYHLNRVAYQCLQLHRLIVDLNRGDILIGVQAAHRQHRFCPVILAAANGGDPKDFTLEIFDRTVFGSNYKPVKRTTQSHRHNAQCRAALERPNGASYRGPPIQPPGDASRDRYAGIHLNELWLQSLFAIKTHLLG